MNRIRCHLPFRGTLLARHRRCLLLGVMVLSGLGTLATFSARTVSADEAPEANAIGRQISAFTLPDYYGREVSLDAFQGSRAVVVCFLGTECPLARFYGPRLQEMSERFEQQDVAFVGINANVQDSLKEIAGYARRHQLKFPILKDLRGDIAERFGATRTPEVFVLDRERVVRYQGRVDAQFTFGSGVGLAQPNETRADLRLALEQVLAGKPVEVAYTPPKGCLLGRVRAPAAEPSVTYTSQISRIIQKHCLKCHREGQIAPFSMERFEDVAGWGSMIAEVVSEQRMPPWHAGELSTLEFRNDARLSDEEKKLIYRWVEEGCPEGDPADLPPPLEFPAGRFTQEKFDAVIAMSPEPVPVKATGVEEYRYYEMPGFDEDRWVKTAECLPGNHAVVHHIIVYARPPGGEPIPPGATGISTQHFSMVAGFAPGTRPPMLPDGWARWIPAGYSLVFEMHYTPIGTPQTDRSSIGMVFMQRDQVQRVLVTGAAMNPKIVIPSKAENHPEYAEKTFGQDTLLLALFPHMHVRGKAFRYELVNLDGTQDILLDVPFYDFNWQNSYTLKEPRLIPASSKLKVTAWYDNSDLNPANPDPSKEVRWGRQSWEEMMIGFYDHGVTVEHARQLLEREAKRLEEKRAKRANPPEDKDNH